MRVATAREDPCLDPERVSPPESTRVAVSKFGFISGSNRLVTSHVVTLDDASVREILILVRTPTQVWKTTSALLHPRHSVFSLHIRSFPGLRARCRHPLKLTMHRVWRSLSVALISGEVCPESPRPITKAVAVQIFTLFCEKRRPLSCRHCTSADAILALSVLHYGASAAGEAQMLLPRVGLLNMVTRKKTGLLAMFRLSLKKRSDRSMSYEEARAQLLMLRDKEVLRARLRG